MLAKRFWILFFVILALSACDRSVTPDLVADSKPTTNSVPPPTPMITSVATPSVESVVTEPPQTEPTPSVTASTTPSPTVTHVPPALSSPTNQSPTSQPSPSATATTVPSSLVTTPQIFTFNGSPLEARLGDSVNLSWSARGNRATICPSARYEYFTPSDCREVPLAGATSFTIPTDSPNLNFIYYLLKVTGIDPATPVASEVSVTILCPYGWFFGGVYPAGICPRDPLSSSAAIQYFERGIMIWVEGLGRYFVLLNEPIVPGELRKQLTVLQDPLNIVQDTSEKISPPSGYFAPTSGFGLVWRGDVSNSPGFMDRLGWALGLEQGYEAIYQCDDAPPSGGLSWQTCYLSLPNTIIMLHPLGGYLWAGEG